ncbi:MAG TPA: HAMP domain-containing sensor histidine kinase [Acidimicrobiales bacterium]|jgi:signal transduction histidine kinase|nr:HAMP domain-containing sensor histidine kinase [Acidimicrobiales bacterium]
MTRRIILAIVAVTALAEVLFAIPLAITFQHRLADEDRLELTQLAALAATRVAGGRLVLTALPRPDPDEQLGLYDGAGRLIDGAGPPRLVGPSSDTSRDRVIDSHQDGWLVVTVPVVASGTIQGLVRSAEPLAAGASRLHDLWAQLAALAAAALILGAVAALGLARRLTRPLEHLGRDAARIGEGDFTVRAARTGLREIDSVGVDLSRTAERVSLLFAREQAFTADASHQLRSPLTGLRLTLEAELAHPRPDHRDALLQALGDVERLETTIEDLLALARDTAVERASVDLASVLDELGERWHPGFARAGRRLTVDIADDVSAPTVSRAALSHVLDVLVDNALRHGVGHVRISARTLHGAVGIAVSDQGPGIADPAAVFERRHSAGGGTGIGLALARRLTEAEGGRLRLQGGGEHTTFEVTLPAADAVPEAATRS